MSFDPKALKVQLEGSVGYKFDLSTPLGEEERAGGLTGHAHSFINTGVACQLVGFREPAKQLFSKAREWLRVAIAKQERPARYFANGTEALRFADLALVNWLIDGVQDIESLEHFVHDQDLYLQDRTSPDRVGLLLSLGDYLSGGYIDRAFELVRLTPGLKYPRSVGKVTNAAHVTFLLKQHGRGEPEVQKAIERFLDRSMDSWLSNGHYDQAAKWVKIAYWSQQDGDVTPAEVVMRCYRHLPNCEAPFR